MAQLDFQINVGGNAGEAVGSLKKQLREAQAEVGALSDKFGATSAEAIKAAKRAAELKDRIGDAKALTDAYNPDAKFKAFSQTLVGVAGGFAAVQGAIGLFGTESKEVEKALLKVQSAMAIAQGLDQVTESIDSFKNLGGIIKGNVIKAFQALKAAIGSTGIGLLVIALAALITNFDSVKKYILNLVPGLAKIGELFGKLLNTVTDFVGITSEAERQLEKLQKTTERGNEEIRNRIKVLSAQGGKEKEIYSESQKLVENDLNVLRKTLSAKGKLTEEEQKKLKELQTEKDVLRITETKRIEDENKKQTEANQKKNDEILKQNEERRLKELEVEQKRRDEVLGVEKQIRAIRQQSELIGLSEKDKRLFEAKQELDNNLILYKDNLDARQKAYILYDEQVKAANAISAEETKAKDVKDNEEFLDRLGKRGAASMANVVAVKQEGTTVVATEEQKQQAYKSTGDAFGALSDAIGRQTAAGKALAVGQALINTFLGVTEVLRNKTTIPEPFGTIQKVASVATILASGYSAVRQIKSTQIPGGGGGGGSVPSISTTAPLQAQLPQAATTNLSSSTINALGNQAIKAYVVETDVTTNQQRVKAIQQRARFD